LTTPSTLVRAAAAARALAALFAVHLHKENDLVCRCYSPRQAWP
jgi:hypothetical protein